jgi:hypothetical protein
MQIIKPKAKNAISFIFIFIFIAIATTNAQTNNTFQKSHEFLNQILNQEKDRNEIYLYKKVLIVDWNKYLNIDFLEKNNSGINNFFIPIKLGLTESDIQQMKKSLCENHINKWKRRKLKKIKLINENKEIDFLQYSTCRYSKPVFNSNYTIALIAEEKVNSPENASSHIYIFRYIDHHWIKIAFIELWIS